MAVSNGELLAKAESPLLTGDITYGLLNPEQARFLHVSSIGLLPMLLLAVGGYVWWRRR